MTDDLRQRLADALTATAHQCDGKCGLDERACYDTHPITWSAMAGGTTHIDEAVTSVANVAVTALKPELDELLHYRNAITWETSCLSCSRILDNARSREEALERNVDYLKRNIRRSRDQVDGYDKELAAAKAALDRVRALHQPVQHMGQAWCAECSHRRSTGTKANEWVAYIPHPCPTLDAIEETP
ncbi:hypothetical protein [Streptomyces platensis]|uniref:hypothetical protein n=1 Tax=Streptomyces platensis TaxID=58346 RepID=UPI00331D9B01